MDWYPWYFLLYKTDTMHLNPYQDGCYRRLIDHYMETRQALPDNDAALSRIIGDSEANWVTNASAIVRAFFKPQKGKLLNIKCEHILNDQDIRSKRQSEIGKNGAQRRWNKINGLDSGGIATPMPNDATLQDIDKIKKERKKEIEAQAPLPEWIPVDPWNGFLEMRKKIKKPLTERAIKLTISELQKLNAAGHDPAAVLDQSTQRNWSGVFPIKDNNNAVYRTPQPAERRNKSDRTKIAILKGLGYTTE